MAQTAVSLHDLEIRAAQADVVTWNGREALRLENGLVLVPECTMRNVGISVMVGTEGSAYSGVAFRVADVLNYELAYAVPHVSGQWDALQYDPVFHGSNTWQLFHGPAYQRESEVPTGRWFRLSLNCCGGQAAVSVDGQPPLVVPRLARPESDGRLGLWTYRPAYFSDLCVSSCETLGGLEGNEPAIPEGTVGAWFVENYGVVACEPNGVVNLGRHLPLSLEKARLSRRFEAPEAGEITLSVGFSDTLRLELDGEVVHEGENTFGGFADRDSRGYVELGTATVVCEVASGEHRIEAEVGVTEGFGWGLTLAARGMDLDCLPADLG